MARKALTRNYTGNIVQNVKSISSLTAFKKNRLELKIPPGAPLTFSGRGQGEGGGPRGIFNSNHKIILRLAYQYRGHLLTIRVDHRYEVNVTVPYRGNGTNKIILTHTT